MTGNRRIHMMLGQIGAVLAACIVILGFRLGIDATQISPPDMIIWGLAPKQFMAVPIISIMIFAGFVIAGVWNRRRPEVHRPMMLLATLAAMPAAVSRIDSINALYHGTAWETVFGPFFGTLAIGAFFLAMKWLLTRSLDRWFAIGYAGLVVSSALIMQLASTRAWDHFASFLLR
jgi:small basic protein